LLRVNIGVAWETMSYELESNMFSGIQYTVHLMEGITQGSSQHV